MPGPQMRSPGVGGGRERKNTEQMFYNPNLRTVILQGECYLKKRKKQKLNGFSGILFSVHIQAIVPVQAAASRARRLQFC